MKRITKIVLLSTLLFPALCSCEDISLDVKRELRLTMSVTDVAGLSIALIGDFCNWDDNGQVPENAIFFEWVDSDLYKAEIKYDKEMTWNCKFVKYSEGGLSIFNIEEREPGPNRVIKFDINTPDHIVYDWGQFD